MEKPIALWHSGYYDGPMSGVCQYMGEIVWFEQSSEAEHFPMTPAEVTTEIEEYGESDDGVYIKWVSRLYKLYSLGDDNLKELQIRHYMWCKYVGRHSCYYVDKSERHCIKDFSIHRKFDDWVRDRPFPKIEINDASCITPAVSFEWDDFLQLDISQLAPNTILFLNNSLFI